MATAAPLQPSAPRQGVIARHPLVFYFIIAYAFSWLAWMPLVLPFSSPLLARWAYVVGNFGPFLSAFVMTGVTEGREGVGRLVRRMVLWRVGLRWYLFAFLGVPAIFLLSVIFLPGALASFQGLATLSPLPLLVLFVYVFFLGGPLGEEPGWRGFALPRLQRMHGPLLGSLILGPLWTFWHLPLFWYPAWKFPPTILNFVLFVLGVTAFTIVMTWIFNNTKGSVFMAVLVHATFDTAFLILNGVFPAPLVNNYGSTVPMLIGFGALAVVLVALTRGRLGYQHYRQEEVEEPDSAAAPA